MRLSLIVLLFFISCSHENHDVDKLNWVYSPYDYCDEKIELCATGESRYFEQSDAQAKANLASIFETRIKKNLDIFESYQSTWLSGSQEQYFESISESINQVIQGLEIVKRAKDKGLYYSLAKLNKQKAAQNIQRQIDVYEEKIKAIILREKRSEMKKLLKLGYEREKLFDTLSLLSDEEITPVIPLKIIFKTLSKFKNKIDVDAEFQGTPDWLETSIKSFLTESGFQLKDGVEAKLRVVLRKKDEFLNVDGFKKISLTLNLVTNQKKSIHYQSVETGRSADDAVLKQKSLIMDYLQENFSQLSLD